MTIFDCAELFLQLDIGVQQQSLLQASSLSSNLTTTVQLCNLSTTQSIFDNYCPVMQSQYDSVHIWQLLSSYAISVWLSPYLTTTVQLCNLSTTQSIFDNYCPVMQSQL